METKPKLEMLKRIVSLGEWSECARVWRRLDRRMMMKLRRGTAGFQVKLRREDGKVCQERREYANYVIVVKWKMWSIG